MKTFTKTIVLTAAVAATTLSTIPAASAGDRWRHHHRHEQRIDAGELAAIGVFGLAAGVIASSIITSNQPEPRGEYIGPVGGPSYDEGYYPPAPQPRRQVGLEPWSRDWFDYCSDRYRSFNPRTGTYTGYDGRAHFCTAG